MNFSYGPFPVDELRRLDVQAASFYHLRDTLVQTKGGRSNNSDAIPEDYNKRQKLFSMKTIRKLCRFIDRITPLGNMGS